MGLIALAWMGFFLLLTGGIVYIYTKGLYTLWQKKQPLFYKLLFTFAIIPLYTLMHYYQNNTDMLYIRGFFGSAPKTVQRMDFNISKQEKLMFEIALDFNTGARGGAFIDRSLYYVKEGKSKKITIRQTPINMKDHFYQKPKAVQTIDKEVQSHKGYGHYYYDLYFSPKLFTHDEFQHISHFLHTHHEHITQTINSYLQGQKEKVYHTVRFRDAYYQDIDGLKKTFKCKNGLMLHLTSPGRLYYITKDHISTSYHDIGKVTGEGNVLQLNKNVKVEQNSDTYTLHLSQTDISNCYEKESGEALFSSLSLQTDTHTP